MQNAHDMAIAPARPEEAGAMEALVAAQGLPSEGLTACLETALVARASGQVVGTAALELYDGGALLRSVAVAAAYRGRGLGRRLTGAALALARQHGARHVYLLTTTAPDFFARQGFRPIERAAVPPSVRASAEFVHLCPASAIVMTFDLSHLSSSENDA
ncbi:GNAT family N-acetyltransferase [Rhodocaloribacter litoris]|uniref:arsenic resistance N-acetyltransferase ArsN2 n=1 Tax=Rhodocaloribacter litoris TaxID=2558931 RepID=UPI001E2B59F1|nr:arsenic resistance N-acetyltransferase ArsN2 [Rhodocaloribacter litoris]QXD15099.1 GNAT family N-acetyltransferase [Rhodocaloribacter litoris]